MMCSAARRISLFLRRSHMYVALFLTPWMTMYALSTFVFNHFESFSRLYGGEMDRYVRERETPYTVPLPAGARPRAAGERILRDLGMDGPFRIKPDEDEEGRLIVERLDPLVPRRITYDPERKVLLIEKQVFRTPGFLTRLHSRLGYNSRYHAANLWAFGVDLSIFGTLLWIFSGFWLWWELKATRLLGILCAAGGMALFGAFVAFA